MSKFKENLGCIIPIVLFVAFICAMVIIPRTEWSYYRSVKRNHECYSCRRYIKKFPYGSHIQQVVDLYKESIYDELDELSNFFYQESICSTLSSWSYKNNQCDVSALAKACPSDSVRLVLTRLSDYMIEYYIQNYNNDTEEFWNKFKKSVDEEHQIIADEHIESIHAAWANEDGALKELLKYIKEQDKISSYDYECMELFFSKYDAYLEQFPESDHADYVLNNYIHFLNRCVNILQKSFSETKDPVILRYEERIKTLTNSEDTRVNRQVYVITLKDYFYYLADVRSKELEMELEMQVEDYRVNEHLGPREY